MAHVQRRERPGGGGRARVEWLAVHRGGDGRRRMKSFPTRTEAKDYLEQLQVDQAQGEYVDPAGGRQTFAAFFAAWRARAVERGRPAASTLAKYDAIWSLHVAGKLGERKLAEITRGQVRDLVEDVTQRVSAYQGLEVLKLVRMLLNRALDHELVVRNVAARIPNPRVARREPDVLTPAEVDRIVEAAGEEWRALVYVAAYCSLRWSELVALKLSRVDFLRRRIQVEEKAVEAAGRLVWGEPKTQRSRRSVAMPQHVVDALAEHVRRWPPGTDGLLFHGDRGGALRRPHFMADVWRPAAVKAEVGGFRFLNLRHTGNTLALAAGARAEDVADRLGHTSTRMTLEVYRAKLESRDREVADALDVLLSDPEASGRLKPAAIDVPSR